MALSLERAEELLEMAHEREDALRARVAELERDLRSETARRERNESALAGERDEAEQRVAELQAEVEIECQARVAAANEREEQRAIAEFQQLRAEEAEKALAEAKLDVGQVEAERDSLLYRNKLLRERRDELQAEVERLTRERDEASVRADDLLRLTEALTESERKRAELLDKHRALHAVVRYHGT